ncbi:MAG: glycerate kinase type-2 family protein, partial [Planctomycetaceae bacterium]
SDATPLRREAVAIWQAGVRAVDSERLVARAVRRDGNRLTVADQGWPVDQIGRLCVVGAGKAGAGMAAAFEQAVGDDLLPRVSGWVNVPADCVRPLQRIHLHAARPAGVNEPRPEGVEGAREILRLVRALGPRDVCVVLLSGGGSALLPAPVPPITLDDKQAVTRLLMHSGASIQELNCVRKQLSEIKGGGLARASRAGATIALIISDVIGDPLETIASGPTVPDSSTPEEALQILDQYAGATEDVPASVRNFLENEKPGLSEEAGPLERVSNHVIGNNAVALAAAAEAARRLGYGVRSLGSDNAGEARDVGRELAELCRSIRDRSESSPACVLSGGEPVVHLAATDQPRTGGRNQEVALAALAHLWDDGLERIVILSGGTDGEDGPTDAAGGIADADVLSAAK